MPKKTSATTIAKIQEDGRAKKTVPANATDNNVSQGTVLRYLAEGGIEPTYGAGSAPTVELQPGGSSEAEEPTPTIYPSAGVVPPRRRAEVRTDFSQPADELTDVARALQARQTIEQLVTPRESALDVALKLDDLSKRQREPLEASVDAQTHEISQLKQMLAQAQKAADSTTQLLAIEKLHGDQQIANAQLLMSIEELKHSNQIEIKKMELGPDGVQTARFWATEGLPALPTVIEKTVSGIFAGLAKANVRPGELLRNSRKVMELVEPGVEVGGMVMERPIKVSDVRRAVRARGRPAGERVEPSDADWEEELELLSGEELRSEGARQRRPPRDHHREEVLATQLAEARREVAELKSRAPSPPSERRVVAAGKPAEEALP